MLDIGNSYTDNYTEYLPYIFETLSKEYNNCVSLFIAERGGASFKSWVDIYNNLGGEYCIKRILGPSDTNIAEGVASKYDGSLFRKSLNFRNWDLIIIHHLSTFSTSFSDWESNEESGYLPNLIKIIREIQPNALIGYLLGHSYADAYSCNTECSSYERWLNIIEATKRLKEAYDVDIIIPCGTAIENLRMSSYNNEHDLTIDGTHLASGLAKYIAACRYYETIFSAITTRPILNTDFKYKVTSKDLNVLYSSSCISVNRCLAKIAQISAKSATYDWYNCYNPETISIHSFQ